MQCNFENGRSHGNKRNRRLATAQRRLELECPVQEVNREHGPQTVADNEDFVEIRAVCCLDEFQRESVKSLLQYGITAVHIAARENPVIEERGELKQLPGALDKPNECGRAGQNAECCRP